METFLLVIHIMVCLFLVFIVLVQGGKGAEMGAAFGGGSSQTLFGGRGAATFLSKLTTGIAIVFMLTSLSLAVVSGSDDDAMDIDLDTPASQGMPINADLPVGTVIDQPGAGQPDSGSDPIIPSEPVIPTAPADSGATGQQDK